MKRLTSKPVDMRSFDCPQCNKNRMVRPMDHIVSEEKREYKAKDGQAVSLFVDICDFCQMRNFKRHFEPTKADVRRILKAIKTEAKLEENQSLENLL